MTLRCALIGCGVIAPTHINAINTYDGAEVSALCDLRHDRLEKLAKECPNATLTTDYRSLLDPQKYDAIFILTEHHTHAPIAIDALKTGMNILCEKPVAAHPAQLRTLSQALTSKTSIAGGVFQHRFERNNQILKQCYEDGLLGTGLTISLEHRCLRDDAYYASDAWRGTQAEEGGSVLINQSIHFIDILRYIGGDITGLHCHVTNRTHGNTIETEDTAVGSFIFASGLLGNFACTSSSKKDQWTYRITLACSNATVILQDNEVSISAVDEIQSVLEKAFSKTEQEITPQGEKKYYGGAHNLNIHDFLDAITTKSVPAITLESAVSTTALIHALYQSSHNKTFMRFHQH